MTSIARDNIIISIAQVDRLHEMEVQAAELENSSSDFQRGAHRVRRLMCVRSWKMLALVLLLLVVLVVIIAVSVTSAVKK